MTEDHLAQVGIALGAHADGLALVHAVLALREEQRTTNRLLEELLRGDRDGDDLANE